MHGDEYWLSVDPAGKKTIVAKDGTSPLGNKEGLTDVSYP